MELQDSEERWQTSLEVQQRRESCLKNQGRGKARAVQCTKAEIIVGQHWSTSFQLNSASRKKTELRIHAQLSIPETHSELFVMAASRGGEDRGRRDGGGEINPQFSFTGRRITYSALKFFTQANMLDVAGLRIRSQGYYIWVLLQATALLISGEHSSEFSHEHIGLWYIIYVISEVFQVLLNQCNI